jgi:hypothetical protein
MTGQRHAPAAFYPRERPGTHCTGGCVGPRAGLDRCGKSRPPPGFDPGPSSPLPVAILTELSGPHYIHDRLKNKASAFCPHDSSCIPYDLTQKQRQFPYTALSHWFLNRNKVYCAVEITFSNVFQKKSRFKGSEHYPLQR